MEIYIGSNNNNTYMSLRELNVPNDSGMLPVNLLAERKLPKGKDHDHTLKQQTIFKNLHC